MSFIHPLADVAECQIGEGTRVWQFVVVLKGARIGADCNICAQTLIEGDVVLGDRVTIKSGVQLWDGLRVEDDVFIGPNVTFTNDKFPRSKFYPNTLPIDRRATVETLGHHAFHLFVVRVQQRAAFQAHLKAAGIDTLIHYPIPPHQQQAYKSYNGLQFPLTETIHQEVVSLPMGPTMSMDDVQKVIAVVNAFADQP